jgi:hypothetical protein
MGRHSNSDGDPPTNVAEPTQVIPRIRPDVHTPWVIHPDSTPTFAAMADGDDEFDTADGHDTADTPDAHDTADTADGRHAAEAGASADAGAAVGHRRSGWVWAGLAAFWLLALGAGLVTLASLGAPHYLCTGAASTGLACENAGTAIAAVLTVVLIVAVGTVSVLAIEARAEARTAWRRLGIGVVALIVVASCGYLLIRTIGG